MQDGGMPMKVRLLYPAQMGIEGLKSGGAVELHDNVTIEELLQSLNLKKEQLEQSGLPDQESLRDRLRKIDPEDFGHYKL